MKLLIVDDEVDALAGMELYFSAKGHEVLTAQGGHEALALVKACKPQLMLLDLKMKGLSGFEIMEKVREIQPGLTTIVITGISQENLEEDCRRLGASRVVHKPVKLEELDEIVRNLSNGR
jgi:DNA-binding response OmpR family regulator